jgi:hypothetical protein
MRAAVDGVMEITHPRVEREPVDRLKQLRPSDFLVFSENQSPS